MALLNSLGIDNGFTNWWDQHRRAMIGLGTGLAQPTPGFGGAAAGLARGAEADDAYAVTQKAEADRLSNINKTTEFLRSKGFDDLATLAEAGQAGVALSEAFNRLKPQEQADPTSTYEGRLRVGQEQGLSGNDLANYALSGDLPVAPKPVDQPASVDEYNFAKSQGYQGDYTTWKTDMAKAGATNIDFNQNQGVAAGFADRMASANDILSDPKLLAAQTDPTKGPLAAIPGVGNYLVGGEYQQAEQAQRDFVNAILRRESGAVISPSEFENAKKQYFPQPGDTEDVIRQKADNRRIAIEGVTRAAGPSYQPPTLSPTGVSVPQVTSSGVQWSVVP